MIFFFLSFLPLSMALADCSSVCSTSINGDAGTLCFKGEWGVSHLDFKVYEQGSQCTLSEKVSVTWTRHLQSMCAMHNLFKSNAELYFPLILDAVSMIAPGDMSGSTRDWGVRKLMGLYFDENYKYISSFDFNVICEKGDVDVSSLDSELKKLTLNQIRRLSSVKNEVFNLLKLQSVITFRLLSKCNAKQGDCYCNLVHEMLPEEAVSGKLKEIKSVYVNYGCV